MIIRRTFLTHIVAFILAVGAVGAGAQPYPNRPVKLILPYTAGSPNDVLARLVSPYLAVRLGQSVVIENRPGGGTSVGAKTVMGADADGYTLLFSNSPTHLIAPLVNRAVTYDPLKDFVPIASVGSSANIMVIAASVPANTIQEFIAYAKANPGKLNFGFGQGTQPQLVGEMFKLAAGVDIASIPYKGGAQAVADMLGGRIHMNVGTLSTLLPLVRDGRVRAMAMTNTTRAADLPDVPTMAEAGLPGVTSVSYYGILGRADTPADIVEKINREMNEALKSPELIASMTKLGFEPRGGTTRDFATLMADEQRKWTPIVKATGFSME